MKFRPALTLIEMMVVISLVAILVVPASMAIGSFRNNQALATSTEELVGALRRAHIYAREAKDGEAWGIRYIDDQTFTLVSGEPDGFTPEGEYALSGPVFFMTDDFEVWFDKGSGNVESSVLLQIGLPSGQLTQVQVSRTGLVEVSQ